MVSIKDIIDRIKLVEGVGTDYKVAKCLGVTSPYISKWRNRQTIPYQVLHEYCISKNLSLDWLLTGEGDMYLPDTQRQTTATRIKIDYVLNRIDRKLHTTVLKMLSGLKNG